MSCKGVGKGGGAGESLSSCCYVYKQLLQKDAQILL